MKDNQGLQFTKVLDIETVFTNALNIAIEKKNAHNKKAYSFALKVLNSIEDKSASLGIRATSTNNVYNIGDLVESILKYHLGYDPRYSLSNEKDLNKRSYHEIKTIPASNRYANSVKQGEPFLVVIESGVYYISKELCNEYHEFFKLDNRNGERLPDLRTIKDIISDNELKQHKYTKLLGLA